MEHGQKISRQQFLRVLGVGVLTVVATKIATLETRINATVPEGRGGYGSSPYGI